ncbi:uncharacterized protein LOC110096855 [Dendrobium catenatum]|uniref:Uncharacterized protein n=1 Tax=Dendrobium catenatum TaxID=906689 RepID=A0A2I0XDN2_9ASPA|nr:uncharacterized protein LOC110096855 [Dendrobium catenatum]PKU86037.1 hypothetical protein MA16_Dca001868 [Dendrobium catenatum]
MADPERIEWSSLVLRAMSKRRTWASLFLLVYALLLCSSWNLILSIRSWYGSAAAAAPSPASLGWPALYASVLYGGVFGLLSMGAALAVAVPATVVTWITVLVLLAFAGKPRRTLVTEGRRITADIAGFAVRILLREGNFVAALCALVSFVTLILRRKGARQGLQEGALYAN